MPKVSQSHLDARRRQILAAAVTCFSRDGFHRATMQDIVEQSRLSPGAIYNYFESKEDIIQAIADERHCVEQAVLAEAQGQPSLAKAIQKIRDAFFAQLEDPAERRRRRVSIQLWVEAQRNPRVHRIVRQGIDGPRKLLGSLIAEAQRRGELPRTLDPDAMARFMIAVFHGFILQLEWDHQTTVEPYVQVLDFCLRRLLTASTGRGPVGRSRSRRTSR